MAKRSGYSHYYFARRRALFKGLRFLPTEPDMPKTKRKPLGKRPAATMVAVSGINGQVPSNMRKSTLDRIRALPAEQHAAAIAKAMASQQRSAAHHARNAAGGPPPQAGTTAAPPQNPPPTQPVQPTARTDRRASAAAQGRTIQPATPMPAAQPTPQPAVTSATAQTPFIKPDANAAPLNPQQQRDADNIADAYGDMYGPVMSNARELARGYAAVALGNNPDATRAYTLTGQIFNQYHVDKALTDHVNSVLGDDFSNSEKSAAKNALANSIISSGGLSPDQLESTARLAAVAKRSQISRNVLSSDLNALRTDSSDSGIQGPSSDSLTALMQSGLLNPTENQRVRGELIRRANAVGGLQGLITGNPDNPKLSKAALDFMSSNRTKYNAGHLNGKDLTQFNLLNKYLDAVNSQQSDDIYDKNAMRFSPISSSDPDLQFAKSEDKINKSLWRDQNFTNPMEVVDDNDFNNLAKSGDFHVLYRGVRGYSGEFDDPDTNVAIGYQKQMQSGDYFAGNGIYGQGTYFSPDISVAHEYSGLQSPNADGGAVMKVLLPKNARTTTTSKLDDEMARFSQDTLTPLDNALKKLRRTGTQTQVKAAEEHLEKVQRAVTLLSQDMGHFASSRGYDAYQIDNDRDGADHWIVLNRSNTISSKKILTRYDDR